MCLPEISNSIFVEACVPPRRFQIRALCVLCSKSDSVLEHCTTYFGILTYVSLKKYENRQKQRIGRCQYVWIKLWIMA